MNRLTIAAILLLVASSAQAQAPCSNLTGSARTNCLNAALGAAKQQALRIQQQVQQLAQQQAAQRAAQQQAAQQAQQAQRAQQEAAQAAQQQAAQQAQQAQRAQQEAAQAAQQQQRVSSFNTSQTTPMTNVKTGTPRINSPSTPIAKVNAAPLAPGNVSVVAAMKSVSGNINPANVYHNGFIYPPGTRLDLQQECVPLVQALTNVGPSSTWTRGTSLSKNGGGYPSINPGTPIATFDGTGKYPATGVLNPNIQGTRGEAHAAIFLGYIRDRNNGQITGMTILEQYAGQPARVWPRTFSSDPYTYSVIR